MKTTKRLLSCLLVLAMLFALAIPAFADETGTITIKNTAPGASYTLYRLFDAQTDTVGTAPNTETVYSYTPATDTIKTFIEGQGSPFEIQAGHVVKVAGKTDDEVRQWIKDNATSFEQVTDATSQNPQTSEGKDITFAGLSYGYYVVVRSDNNVTAAEVGGNTLGGENVVIYDKNTAGVPITPPDGQTGYKTVDGEKTASAELGSELTFTVEFKTSNYAASEDYPEVSNPNDDPYLPVTSYEIVDTPTNMTITTASVKKVEAQFNGTTGEISKDNYKVENGTAAGSIKITLDWYKNDAFLYNEGTTIKVTYIGTVTAKSASNTAQIIPYVNGNAIENPPEDPEVVVKSVDFQVHKTNADGSISLEGAEFVLSKEVVEEGSTEEVTKYYKLDGETVTWVTDKNAATKITDKDGLTKFEGLAEGEYTLEETKAPNGYNALNEAITLKIESNGKTGNDYALVVKQVTGNNDTTLDLVGTVYQIQVVNEQGTLLPSTGGIGTTMFYVIGGLMVAAAVVVLVSKKRMGAEQ